MVFPAIATHRWYLAFKLAVFALLALNAAAYAVSGTLTGALDSAAWLILLALLELETAHRRLLNGKSATAGIRAIRLVAALVIPFAAIRYVQQQEWLDAINAWLWIAVVVLLEIEVRFSAAVQRRRAAFAGAAATLYAGLAGAVAAWAWRGEWFDAYDALLWLIAFVTIELNVLRIGVAAPHSERGAVESRLLLK